MPTVRIVTATARVQLRLRVAAIKTTDDVRGAIHAGLALGMDPL